MRTSNLRGQMHSISRTGAGFGPPRAPRGTSSPSSMLLSWTHWPILRYVGGSPIKAWELRRPSSKRRKGSAPFTELISRNGGRLSRRRESKRNEGLFLRRLPCSQLSEFSADRIKRPELVLLGAEVVRVWPVGGVHGLLQTVRKVLVEVGFLRPHPG